MIAKNRIAARVKDIAKKSISQEFPNINYSEMNEKLEDPRRILSAMFEYLEELETKRVPKIMQISLATLRSDYLRSLDREFEEMQKAANERKAKQDAMLLGRYSAEMGVYRSIPWPLRFLVPKPVKSRTMPRKVLRPQPTFDGFIDFIQNAEMTVEIGEL